MTNKDYIKKELYKQKPTAYLDYVVDGKVIYYTDIKSTDFERFPTTIVRSYFEVPITDIGNTRFGKEEPAQQLIRWLMIQE